MIKKITLTTLTLALLVMLTSVTLAANEARVRVVHASPNAPGVDIVVNDVLRPFTGVEFGDVTDYEKVPASFYNVKVTPEGLAPSTAVIDANLNLFYNERYTVVAVDYLEDISAIVMIDNPIESLTKQARLRFVHVSPDAPAVDVKVLDGPYLYEDVMFKDVGNYVDLPQGRYTIQVLLAGTDSVALELNSIYLSRGRTYTAFAAGLVDGTPGLTAILKVDERGQVLPWFYRGR